MTTFPKWLTVAVAASGWVVALAVGILDLPAKINSFTEEAPKAAETVGNSVFLNKALTGTWSTENFTIGDYGDQPPPAEGGSMWLTMRVYKGVADGEVVSEGLKSHWLASRVMFQGTEQNGAVEGMVFDYRDGKPLALAWVTISPDPANKGLMHLKVTKQGPLKFVPDEAVLYPADAEGFPHGELNTNMLMDAVKAAQSEAKR